jgi:Flp pilus assembly protein TadD
VEEMLYAATLVDDVNAKEDVYKATTEIYPNDARAYNNIASMEYAKGNIAAAKQYLEKAQQLSSSLPEAAANLGMIALMNGDIQSAETFIAKANGANGLEEVLGNLNLAKGNYAQAEQDFKDVYSNSAALAQILNKNYASAAVTLKYVKNPDATTDYLKSILAARMGNTSEAAEALRAAIAKDASYAKYAANDLELLKVAK